MRKFKSHLPFTQFTPKLGLPLAMEYVELEILNRSQRHRPVALIHQKVWVILAVQVKIWPHSIA